MQFPTSTPASPKARQLKKLLSPTFWKRRRLQAIREGGDDLDLEPDLRLVGSGLRRRPGADRSDARSAAALFDRGQHTRRKLPAEEQAACRLIENPDCGTSRTGTDMS